LKWSQFTIIVKKDLLVSNAEVLLTVENSDETKKKTIVA